MARTKVVINRLNSLGQAIGTFNGMDVVVPNLLVGEEAEIQIVHKGHKCYYGKVLNRTVSSDKRAYPKCNKFFECGGCQLQHMDYQAQLDFKLESVNSLFKEAGIDYQIDKIVGMKYHWNYRYKIQAPIVDNKRGFYQENSHKFIKINNCLIESNKGQEIIEYLLSLNISNLDYVYIREGKNSGEVLLVLVTTSEEPLLTKSNIEDITIKYRDVRSIVQSVKITQSNKILGDKNNILYGDGTITDLINGITFKIGVNSFFQVNPSQMEELYRLALESSKINSTDTIVDAYCGVGTISLLASRYCKKAIGIEIVQEAIDNAKENALINNITNVEFYCGDVIDYLAELKDVDILFVDPPRKGLDSKFIEAVKLSNIKKVIYISCNPKTLVDNIKELSGDYSIENVTLVDMFPHTNHVEVVSFLYRKNSKQYGSECQ